MSIYDLPNVQILKKIQSDWLKKTAWNYTKLGFSKKVSTLFTSSTPILGNSQPIAKLMHTILLTPSPQLVSNKSLRIKVTRTRSPSTLTSGLSRQSKREVHRPGTSGSDGLRCKTLQKLQMSSVLIAFSCAFCWRFLANFAYFCTFFAYFHRFAVHFYYFLVLWIC